MKQILYFNVASKQWFLSTGPRDAQQITETQATAAKQDPDVVLIEEEIIDWSTLGDDE